MTSLPALPPRSSLSAPLGRDWSPPPPLRNLAPHSCASVPALTARQSPSATVCQAARLCTKNGGGDQEDLLSIPQRCQILSSRARREPALNSAFPGFHGFPHPHPWPAFALGAPLLSGVCSLHHINCLWAADGLKQKVLRARDLK